MRTRTHRTRTALAALTIATAGVLTTATPAHADAPPEYDQVRASVAGDSIVGQVYWPSYRQGSATVTVHNDWYDGLCVSAQQRVMRNGVWSAWSDIVVGCYERSYTRSYTVAWGSSPVQYWQFRVRDAASSWAYDTNSPGGA